MSHLYFADAADPKPVTAATNSMNNIVTPSSSPAITSPRKKQQRTMAIPVHSPTRGAPREEDEDEILHPLASFLSQTSPLPSSRNKAHCCNASVVSAITQDSMASLDFYDMGKELSSVVLGESSASSELTSSNSSFGMRVQHDLRWGCDPKLAQRYCNNEHDHASCDTLLDDEEEFDFEIQSSFEEDAVKEVRQRGRIKFYDSSSGKTLFMVRKESPYRTFDDFVQESLAEGFLCFRDYEVNWERVRCRDNGELYSKSGTRLGFQSSDREGSKYLVNLLAVAGKPVRESKKKHKAQRRSSMGSMMSATSPHAAMKKGRKALKKMLSQRLNSSQLEQDALKYLKEQPAA
ncbi:MAG: hypothetical protein SGILL_001443 [Bacillariaceae sp.]